MADKIDPAEKRVDSAHEEEVIGDRSRCQVCGWIDEANPEDPAILEWHGDSFDE